MGRIVRGVEVEDDRPGLAAKALAIDHGVGDRFDQPVALAVAHAILEARQRRLGR